jgi:CRP-like cAMP-binding protein
MDATELKTKLKTIKLFSAMSDDFFAKFIPFLKTHHFNTGSAIIKEGETGRDMFILIKGTVRVVKKTMSGDEYTAALLKDEYGIIFGEVGLLSEEKRSASVITENPCDIAELKCDDFNKFLDAQPVHGIVLLKNLSTSICQKLSKSNTDTVALYEALVNEIGQAFL